MWGTRSHVILKRFHFYWKTAVSSLRLWCTNAILMMLLNTPEKPQKVLQGEPKRTNSDGISAELSASQKFCRESNLSAFKCSVYRVSCPQTDMMRKPCGLKRILDQWQNPIYSTTTGCYKSNIKYFVAVQGCFLHIPTEWLVARESRSHSTVWMGWEDGRMRRCGRIELWRERFGGSSMYQNLTFFPQLIWLHRSSRTCTNNITGVVP